MGVTTFVALALAACGGGGGTTGTDAPTTVVPATTDAPAATDTPTTTVAGMSRDAALALARCLDATGPVLGEQVTLDRAYLKDAIDVCKEASLQVEVEAAAPDGLYLDMLKLNSDLAYADYTIAIGEWDPAAEAKLQVAVDQFSQAWG